MRRAYWKRRMQGVPDVLARFEEQGGLRVASGPFAGMQLAKVYSGSSLLPKVAGSYEDEVTPAIEAIVAGDYDTIIDIGSAEGYYAVGLARACPKARIVAYDCVEKAREALKDLADVNGVADRIEICGDCTLESLKEAVKGETFVICDIEGAERELMDPEKCPPLAACDLLVEMHVQDAKDTADVIRARFAATHEMESFLSKIKDPAEYPALEFLPANLRAVTLDEMRLPGQEWVWFKRKPEAATP